MRELLPDIRGVAAEYDDRVLLGEIHLPVERRVSYYGMTRPGVHLPFSFQLIAPPWNAAKLDSMIYEYERLVPEGKWLNWVLGDHDKPRTATCGGTVQLPFSQEEQEWSSSPRISTARASRRASPLHLRADEGVVVRQH